MEETITAWADIVIEIWQGKLARQNVHHTGELSTSFERHVQLSANGEPQLVQFLFNYYGKFVDLGVGKGVPLMMVPYSNRKPKFWYKGTLNDQVAKLNTILAEKYAKQGSIKVVENLSDNALKWETKTIF